MARICVLGSTNLDLNFATPQAPGKWKREVYVESISTSLGGKGLHTARAAAWLGNEVTLLTPSSDDTTSSVLSALLEECIDSIALAHEESPEVGTMRALTHPSNGPCGIAGAITTVGRRPTFLARRHREHWGAFDLPSRWAVEIAEANALILTLEPPLVLVRQAIAAASPGTTIVLNLGPPPRDDEDRLLATHLIDSVSSVVADAADVDFLFSSSGKARSPEQRLRLLTNGLSRPRVAYIGGRTAEYGKFVAGSEPSPATKLSTAQDPVGTNSMISAALAHALTRGQTGECALAFAMAAAMRYDGSGPVDLARINATMAEGTST